MASSPPRVSLRAIAEKAGVTRMTVSLALRGSSTISAATRARIDAVAQELGYRRDPVVSELMGRLRKATFAKTQSALAVITNQQGKLSWRTSPTHRKYFEGAQRQAQALGFKLDEFRLNEAGMTERRASQIMWARGIEGGIIFPILDREAAYTMKLDWPKFTFVAIGYSLMAPRLHRSCLSHMRAALEASQQLRALGYKRLGLALDANQDRRAGHGWSAGFLTSSHIAQEKDPIPLLTPDTLTFAEFSRWFRQHKPDAVVHIAREGDIVEWIERCGARVPDDVGYVFLDLWSTMHDISGMDQQSHLVGAAAIDLAVAELRQGERGLPQHPKIIMTEGIWRPARTTRRLI